MKNKIKVFKNILLMSAPEYIAGFSVFAILIFFSKKASLAEIGELTYANTVGQLIASMLAVALLTTMRRDFALKEWLRDKQVFSLYIVRSVIFLAILLIVFFLFKFELISQIVFLMIVSRNIDSLSETYYYTLLSKNSYVKFSILKSFHYLSLIGSVLVGIMQSFNIHQIVYVFLLNSVLWSLINFTLLFFEKNITKKLFILNKYQKNLFKRAFPLLLSSVIYLLSTRLNVLIVKKICNPEDFGLFSIIITLLGIFSIFTSAISNFFINQQVEWYKSSSKLLKNRLIKLSGLFFLLGVAGVVVIYFASDYVNYLFKNFDMERVWLLKLAMVSILAYFLQIPYNYLFTILDKNKLALYFSIAMIIVASVLYYSFTVLYGLEGAVWALLIYNILWCSALFLIAMNVINKQILKESND
ncbi:hypothetical protein F3J23_02455 [Chryseobacterium sp. Tr-659]|uniref:hypothetical protein n=1 Tax=Chryseobacterium sp. Tr-659 TaxID=2608340 RepID=UPI00142030B0|nr:hypothetical protein [Chryseobacterium sp. Tr-659]NIF04290.1 hypothetical protein [Chryseobacterium sp. Tr-659]